MSITPCKVTFVHLQGLQTLLECCFQVAAGFLSMMARCFIHEIGCWIHCIRRMGHVFWRVHSSVSFLHKVHLCLLQALDFLCFFFLLLPGRSLLLDIDLTVISWVQILTSTCILIPIELSWIRVRVQVKYHHVPVEDVFFQCSDDLNVRWVPTVEVLPNRRIHRFKIKVLDQIGFQSLSLTLRFILVQQIDICYSRRPLIDCCLIFSILLSSTSSIITAQRRQRNLGRVQAASAVVALHSINFTLLLWKRFTSQELSSDCFASKLT